MSNKRKTPGGSDNVNTDISDMLLELAAYEKNNRQVHKYNAYRKAAAAIGRHPTKITSGDEAKNLPGVGKKIADKITELLSTGKLNKLEKIRADDTSVAVKELTRVSGIGPVLAHQLVKDGITTIEDLRAKGVNRLSTAQAIGLRYLEDLEARIPRPEMEALEKFAIDAIKKVDSGYTAVVCGSYRRGAETSGDIDILISHPDYANIASLGKEARQARVKAIVKGLGGAFVKDTIALGPSKFMGVCRHPDYPTHRRIDISLLPWSEYWCGVLYFTGSDEFNRQMRSQALKLGYTLNEHCLSKVGKKGKAGAVVPISSEREVFEFLDMEYKEPTERNY